jgi:hypothetical protein
MGSKLEGLLLSSLLVSEEIIEAEPSSVEMFIPSARHITVDRTQTI